ncbi:hypothetical protein SDC9_203598 [bioreactor metagenome]|uniref:Uncharacterized protein n=1 Tax=bioreactor metagenome TaxID=1076179 RepID=A0A645J609_9ZZZZ
MAVNIDLAKIMPKVPSISATIIPRLIASPAMYSALSLSFAPIFLATSAVAPMPIAPMTLPRVNMICTPKFTPAISAAVSLPTIAVSAVQTSV